jgi:hypothetical protein
MMNTLIKIAMVFSLCFFCLLSTGELRAVQTGEIHGKVTDEGGEPLPGVGITAKSPRLQGIRTTLSNENGNFRLPLLPVGDYSLTYELDGFEKLTTTGNRVYLGATLSVSVVLKTAVLSEEVTVTAVNPLIDKKDADNSYRLTGDALTYVPSQARTIDEVVSFTPGVTGVRTSTVTGTDSGSPGFRGEGNAGNNWLVDGFPLKGAFYNDFAVQIGYDTWEEVEIISDGFTPELGQAMGGFINILTKSGGNAFHGELGVLVRDSHLRADRQEQLSAATVPETSLSNYFGNLGGPILKDKLWFFISNNLHRSLDITQEQILGWLTIPDGKRRIYTNNIFGKVTYTPQKNHTVSLSAALDSFLDQNGGIDLPELYVKETYSDYFYRLNYTGILSQNTLLIATVGQYNRDFEQVPLSEDFSTPSYFWLDIGHSTNNFPYSGKTIEQRIDLAINLTQYLSLGQWGEHEIVMGLSFNKSSGRENYKYTGKDFDPWVGNGFDNGLYISWQAPGIPALLMEYGPVESENSQRGFGLSIRDTVSIGRFSLMVGLRAETQKVFNNIGEPIWSWGLGDFLTPRASLVIDLLDDGKNILKFGFGRFAQSQSLGVLSFFNPEWAWQFRNSAWIGGENPSEAQLKSPSNWEFLYEQSGAAIPMAVDPDIKPNKSTKFLLEFNRQLGTYWALKVRGIYSYSKNRTDDILIYDPVLQPENLVYFFYTNFELTRRDYRAFEVELNGRIAQRFWLNASYTWSQAKGTNPGDWAEYLSWEIDEWFFHEGSYFGCHPDVPEGDPNKEFLDWLWQGLGGPGSIGDEGWYGFLPYSVDHQIKILGTYFAPYGFVISSVIEYLSGYYWDKKGYSPLGLYMTYPEGRGSRTTPSHMYVDIAVEKEFVLKKGIRLRVGLNFYNFFNSQKPVSYIKSDTELFGQIWGRQLPRWVQFKATLRF